MILLRHGCMDMQYIAAGPGSGHRRGDQLVGGEGYEEIAALIGAGGQPVAICTLGKDHHHAFFLVRLVIVAEEGIVVSVDGEHRIALLPLAGRVAVAVPRAGDAQRRAVGPREARGQCFAGSPVRLEDGIGGNDAVLRPAPRVAEGEGVGDAVVAGVEGG